MKLRSWVKKVLVVALLISLIFIATTIDSEYTKEYIILLITNLIVLIGSSTLLIKFGGLNE